MGYLLNSLSNLPIDDAVKLYVFVINGQWREPLYDILDQNFSSIARSIGNNAVIAKGLDAQEFYGEIERKYLGNDHNKLFNLLPALLITDSHPDQITDASMRLIVPLAEVQTRFGGWGQFFRLLTDFVQFRDDEFLKRFERQESLIDAAGKIVEVKPEFFGVSVNVNELVAWWRRRAAHAGNQ